MGRQSLVRLSLLGIVLVAFCLFACEGAREDSQKRQLEEPTAQKTQNVLFLMLDTLRADHLGFMGYSRETSPVIDALAGESLAFTAAYTAAPWTPPSVASMLTGYYPASHGMMPSSNREFAEGHGHVLGEKSLTLAEALRAHGYSTAAVSSNPWIDSGFGYSQGFQKFLFMQRASAETITGEGIKLIEDLQKQGKPWFLYLHYLDPHDPYAPPPPYRGMFSGAVPPGPFDYDAKALKNINLYDGEIRYLDSQLGRLFEFLKAQGIYDDLGIVLIADHGEQFGERGNYRHGFHVHAEEVHIPFIVKSGQAASRISEPVSTVDAFATALDMAGVLEKVRAGPSRSLLRSLRSAGRLGVFSEISRVYRERAFTNLKGEKVLIRYQPCAGGQDCRRRQLGVSLFDRQSDPGERKPLDDAERLEKVLAEFRSEREASLLQDG